MTDLADMLRSGTAAGDKDNPGAWPYEQTEFGASMRRRADRLPQIPHRLSLSNFLKGMYNAAADVNDFLWASRWGSRPGVIGFPDLVHTPGQEDYRAAPIGPQHIIAMRLLGVPTRGAPAEDRKNFSTDAYQAWLKQQDELEKAKTIAEGPFSPNATRAKAWDPGGGLY